MPATTAEPATTVLHQPAETSRHSGPSSIAQERVGIDLLCLHPGTPGNDDEQPDRVRSWRTAITPPSTRRQLRAVGADNTQATD